MNHMVEPENAGVQIVTGWSLSILLHGALLIAIFTMMPKMIVAVEKEAFRWDVALVDRPQEQSAPPTVQEKAVPPSAKPQRRTVSRPVEPAPPQTLTRQVQAREVLQPVQREAQPVVETVQPIQRQEAAHEVVNPPSPELKQIEPVVREIASADVIRETTTPIEQKAVQPVTAVTETAREEVTPVLTGQPSIESRQENMVVNREPTAAVSNSAPVVQQSESIAETPMITREAVQPIQETVSPIEAATPAPVIARSVTPSPAPKADHRWLADSLHRRVNELRHYPRTARLNGLQGKVVLRVSINKEGNLEDVSVMKSSGHESLDNAAMEAVRRACPLHLKHELEAPKVVMTLPVTYSLGQ